MLSLHLIITLMSLHLSPKEQYFKRYLHDVKNHNYQSNLVEVSVMSSVSVLFNSTTVVKNSLCD